MTIHPDTVRAFVDELDKADPPLTNPKKVQLIREKFHTDVFTATKAIKNRELRRKVAKASNYEDLKPVLRAIIDRLW